MLSSKFLTPRLVLLLGLAAGLATAPTLSAQKINDAAGDWAPTYLGPKNGDLDVLSSQVYFDGAKFAFTATMAGPIGFTPGAFYVWGINRGTPNPAPFAANGAPNVVFDATVILRPGTGVTAGGAAVNDFFFFWSGNTVTAVVPASFLGLTLGGFASRDLFTWNLWPRATGPAANAAISDFAPDNAMATMTLSAIPAALLVTPEPASFVLVGAGLLGMFVAARRRRV